MKYKKEPLSRKLSLGIFYLLSSSVTSLGLNIIIIAFVARALGVENFGLYSAILSFVQLFQFLTDFGLNRTLLKFGSTDITKTQVGFGNALYLKTLLILPTLALITIFGLIAGYRGQELLILELFAVGLVFDSYSTVFSSIRRIFGSFKLISFFRILKTTINLLIVVLAILINNSVLSLAAASAILNIVTFIVSLINTVSVLKPKLNLTLLKDFFKDSVIFSLSDFFLNIYARISVVLLAFSCDLYSVGIFSAALRFTRIANLLPTQVRFALLPAMYRILGKERQDSRQQAIDNRQQRVFTIIYKYMVILATPLAFTIYFFSSQIIHLIFGTKYDSSIPLVQLFSIFIYLRFVQTPFSLFYIAMNKHKKMVFFQGLTSTLNVILNLILIPQYKLNGAAWATIISEAFLGILLIFMGVKYLIWRLQDISVILLKSMLAGGLSIFLCTLVLGELSIFIKLSFAFALYLLFLLLVKMFEREDKNLFVKIFAKNSATITK